MKTNTLLLLQAAAAAVLASPVTRDTGVSPAEALERAVARGYPVRSTAKVLQPEAVHNSRVPQVQQMQPVSRIANTKKTKIRYGSYTLPSTKEVNFQSEYEGDPGMLDSIVSAPKPCTDDCRILSMVAGLEYENGTDANTDTGSWLHHIVLFNTGKGATDAACGTPGIDSFFSSGNERSLTVMSQLNQTTATSGYHLHAADTLSLYSELMNMDPYQKKVYITLEWEYLEGAHPELRDTRAVWLEIHQCGQADPTTGNLDAMSRPLKQVFTETSPMWTSKWSGDLLSVAGHLHDGGVQAVIYQNKNVLCDSKAHYGGTAAYQQQGGMANSMAPAEHISLMDLCLYMGSMKVGDQFHIDADYNFNEHPGMKTTSGQLDEIMGISILYVAIDGSATATTSST